MLKYSDNPLNQSFQLEGVKHILPAEAWKAFESNCALAVDVREESEVVRSSVDCPQLLIIPMSRLAGMINEMPGNVPVVCMSNHGVRGTQAAQLMQQRGFTSVFNLDGGIHGWIEAGLPVASEGGCSCGCH